jgi:hypothetical protein
MTPFQALALLASCVFAVASVSTTLWLIGLLKHVLRDTYALQDKLREALHVLLNRAQRAEEQLAEERSLLREALAKSAELEVARQEIDYLQGQLHQHQLALIDGAQVAQARIMALLSDRPPLRPSHTIDSSPPPPEPIDEGPWTSPPDSPGPRSSVALPPDSSPRIYKEPMDESVVDAGLRAVMATPIE